MFSLHFAVISFQIKKEKKKKTGCTHVYQLINIGYQNEGVKCDWIAFPLALLSNSNELICCTWYVPLPSTCNDVGGFLWNCLLIDFRCRFVSMSIIVAYVCCRAIDEMPCALFHFRASKRLIVEYTFVFADKINIVSITRCAIIGIQTVAPLNWLQESFIILSNQFVLFVWILFIYFCFLLFAFLIASKNSASFCRLIHFFESCVFCFA